MFDLPNSNSRVRRRDIGLGEYLFADDGTVKAHMRWNFISEPRKSVPNAPDFVVPVDFEFFVFSAQRIVDVNVRCWDGINKDMLRGFSIYALREPERFSELLKCSKRGLRYPVHGTINYKHRIDAEMTQMIRDIEIAN